MLSLIVLITAGFLTSATAISYASSSGATLAQGRRSRAGLLSQICIAGFALGAILLAVHVQLGESL
jgi:hypothetical protein